MDTFLRVNFIRDGGVSDEQEEKEIHHGIQGGSGKVDHGTGLPGSGGCQEFGDQCQRAGGVSLKAEWKHLRALAM